MLLALARPLLLKLGPMLKKVMLVEDDQNLLSLLSMLLQLEGLVVSPTLQDLTFEAVYNAIQSERPALILLDIHLRGFNGFDLLQRLRQEASLKPLRVLMCSGMDYGMRCTELGADGFILKPYMPDELVKKIRKLLEE